MGNSDKRVELPIHPIPTTGVRLGTIRVDGRVGRPLALGAADLDALAQQTLVDDFTCVEGWSVPGLVWKGVPLAVVVELAEILPDARWIQASAGEYSVPLSLDDAGRALLARRLGEQPLPTVHGGPVRLVVPGRECFTSVKWLDHLEACLAPSPDRAREIVLRRLGRDDQAPRESQGMNDAVRRDAHLTM